MLHFAAMYNGFAIKYVGKIFTAVVFVSLFMLMASLYRQNTVYKDENRRLVLQNDSLFSVNLELTQSAEKNEQNPKLSVFKTAR